MERFGGLGERGLERVGEGAGLFRCGFILHLRTRKRIGRGEASTRTGSRGAARPHAHVHGSKAWPWETCRDPALHLCEHCPHTSTLSGARSPPENKQNKWREPRPCHSETRGEPATDTVS